MNVVQYVTIVPIQELFKETKILLSMLCSEALPNKSNKKGSPNPDPEAW